MSYFKKMEYEIVLKDSFWIIRNCHNLFPLVSACQIGSKAGRYYEEKFLCTPQELLYWMEHKVIEVLVTPKERDAT